MLRYGLTLLNELDEIEECKQQEASLSSTIVSLGSAAPKHDFFSTLSPSFFNRIGVNGRTLLATLGS
jgi:hypothetical protein